LGEERVEVLEGEEVAKRVELKRVEEVLGVNLPDGLVGVELFGRVK
jgi:hypothetical protein